MVSSQAQTPEEYINDLPPGRREAVQAVADTVRRSLPPGYEEGMQYGMIGWYVPFDRLPDTYNGQPLGYVALASQKNYMSLYLNHVYGDPQTERWLRDEFATAGKRLDMGRSCIRFRRLEDLPLDVIGRAVARTPVDEFVALYRAARARR